MTIENLEEVISNTIELDCIKDAFGKGVFFFIQPFVPTGEWPDFIVERVDQESS